MPQIFTLSIIVILTLSILSPAGTTWAGEDLMENCLKSVKKRQKGQVVKVEALTFEGKAVYEFEVRNGNGTEHELMCDTQTGKVFEIETEVDSASDPLFKSKIDLDTAIKTVLKKYPGKVTEIEYEIEENGMPTYEIDVINEEGRETKVEVDAVSGKIIEVSEEKWQIGEEEKELYRQ